MEVERGPPDGAGDSLLQSPTNDKSNQTPNTEDTTSTSTQKEITENICSQDEFPVTTMEQSEDKMALATAKDTRTPENTGTKEGSREKVKYPVCVLDTTEDKAALATSKDFVKDNLALYGSQRKKEEEESEIVEEDDQESLNASENLNEDEEEQSESYEEQEDAGSLEEADQDCEKGCKKVKDVVDDTAVFGAEGPTGKLGKGYVEDGEVNDQEDNDLMLIKEAEDKVKELQQHHRNHTLVVSNLQDTARTVQRIAAHQLREEHHTGSDLENLATRLDMAHKNAAQSCSQYNEVIRLFQDFLHRAKENATQSASVREIDDRSVVYVEEREEEASDIERPTSLHVNDARDVTDTSLSTERSPSRQIHTISPSQVAHYCKMWTQLREDGRVPEGRDGFFMDNIAWTWDDIGAVGQGTFGTVHLGQPQPYFAVKKVDMDRFEADEVEILAQLDHAAVVKLLAVVRDGNTMHICTEYLGDEVVERVINQNAGLSEPTALAITIQLLEGLVYLHSFGIVHRDVKAANAVLCRVSDTEPDRVQVKLIDFGSATRIPKGHKWVHEEEREPKGTPTHMSPEMARAEEHNCTTDIWSLGCTTLHMLTGRHPWQKYAVRSFQLIYQIGAYPHRILDDIPHTTHGSLRQLLGHCFNQCRKERPQAQAILDIACEVHQQVSGQPTSIQDASLISLQPSSLKASVASCLSATAVQPSSSVLPPPPGAPPRALTPSPPTDSVQSTKASAEVSDPRDLDKMRKLLEELERGEEKADPPTTPIGSCQVAEDVVSRADQPGPVESRTDRPGPVVTRTDRPGPVMKMPSFVPTNTLSQSVDLYRTWAQGELGLASGMDSLELGPDMAMANWDLPTGCDPLVTAQDTELTPNRPETTEPACPPNTPYSVSSKPTAGSSDHDERVSQLGKNDDRAGSQETPSKPTHIIPKTLRLDIDSEQSTAAKPTSVAMSQMSNTDPSDNVQSSSSDRQELLDARPRSGSGARGISRLACNFTNPHVPKQ